MKGISEMRDAAVDLMTAAADFRFHPTTEGGAALDAALDRMGAILDATCDEPPGVGSLRCLFTECGVRK